MKTTINNTEVDLLVILNKVQTSKTGKYSKNIDGTKFTFEVFKKEETFLSDDILFGQSKYGEEFEIEIQNIMESQEVSMMSDKMYEFEQKKEVEINSTKTNRTFEEQIIVYDKLFWLDQAIIKNEIRDKDDSNRICLLDLHRMDGLNEEQMKEVDELADKYLKINLHN